MLDTKGPEIRTGSFAGGVKHVEIPSGAQVILTTDPAWADKGTPEKIFVDYRALGRTCVKGGNILLDDGIIKLEVVEPLHRSYTTEDPERPVTETLCVVKNRNPVSLGARKGTNIPGAILELPALTGRDKADLEWGVDNDVDFVAASFVRKAADVRSVVVHLERLMAKRKPNEANPRLLRPLVISKVENAEAIKNFDEILAESDGIMVARGDLGVEVPFQDVFTAQKMVRCAIRLAEHRENFFFVVYWTFLGHVERFKSDESISTFLLHYTQILIFFSTHP
jgi:pyruvate kinase